MDARRTRIGADDLPDLFAGATRVVVAQGRRSTAFDLRPGGGDMQALVEHALGRSGNLRAPSVRVGTRWLVGYGEAAWAEALGG